MHVVQFFVYVGSFNTANAYYMERTLCDILQLRANIDIQIVSEAFKQHTIYAYSLFEALVPLEYSDKS